MKNKNILSVIFVYFNTPLEITEAIVSLEKNTIDTNYEIIIIDNASLLTLPNKVKKNKRVKIVVNNQNKGYGAAINQAVSVANGKILLFINPDTITKLHAIDLLYKKLISDKKIGVIGPRLLSSEGETLHNISEDPSFFTSLVLYSPLRNFGKFKKIIDKYNLSHLLTQKQVSVDVIGGAVMMLRTEVFLEAGGFDEDFFMYFEEADLCRRIRSLGYEVVYYPKASIIHLGGRSSQDKRKIQSVFEKSRYIYFKKYFGILKSISLESLIRIFQKDRIFLIGILCISAVANLNRINDAVMFFGDYGHDYLAARDMLLQGKIPLVGITSSVTWLHQGPLSIYLIALAFFAGRFNPFAPAIFYAVLGILTTGLVYKLGTLFFNKKTGLLSAIFFATSPLTIVNVRAPYHTGPIPFFACLFFYFLYKIFDKKATNLNYFLSFLLLGILILFELSNAVLVIVVLFAFIFFKVEMTKRQKVFSGIGLLIGILPFLLYDITHQFRQTIGFPLWILNRMRIFFGIGLPGAPSNQIVDLAHRTIPDQLILIMFPLFHPLAIVLCLLLVMTLCINWKRIFKDHDRGLTLAVLWFFVPLAAFFVHANPGTAYFPLIFPAIALLLGYTFDFFFKRMSILYILVIIIFLINVSYTMKYQYFLDSSNFKASKAPGWSYGLGTTLGEQIRTVRTIIVDAHGESFNIKGVGFLAKYSSSIDNYRYLLWWLGGDITEKAKNTYLFYFPQDVPPNSNVIFSSEYIAIVKK